MSRRIAGLDRHRPLEFGLRILQKPLVQRADESEGRQRLREFRVDLKRPKRRRSRLRERPVRRDLAEPAGQGVTVRHAHVSEGVVGIDFERPPEVRESGREARSPPGPVVASLQIEGVGLDLPGGLAVDTLPFRRCERGPEPGGDLAGHVALDREHGIEIPVILLGPQVIVGPGVDQLGVDPDSAPGPLNLALQDRRGSQLRADRAHGLRGVPVPGGRSARNHLQAADLGQLIDDVVGHTIAEVLGVGVAPDVHEGENRHRTQVLEQVRSAHFARELRDLRRRVDPQVLPEQSRMCMGVTDRGGRVAGGGKGSHQPENDGRPVRILGQELLPPTRRPGRVSRPLGPRSQSLEGTGVEPGQSGSLGIRPALELP